MLAIQKSQAMPTFVSKISPINIIQVWELWEKICTGSLGMHLILGLKLSVRVRERVL
jgi:hypothetical protein